MNEIIEMIKKDKLKDFEMKISETNLNLCLGRFPLLSICYLYNSKKIIKKYEELLLKIKDYEILNEPKELYFDFKKVAGRCLRLYVNNEIVSPLEMLLILGEGSKVEDLYLNIANNNAIKNRLIGIQRIKTSEEIAVNDRNIIIPKQPLSKKKRQMIKGVIAIMSVMMIISIFVIGWFCFTGVNVDGSTMMVFTSQQLVKSLEKNVDSVKLMSDIVLNNVNIAKLNSSIDGNGHTITVNNKNGESLFDEINKEIKNINIVYNLDSVNIESNTGFIADVNYGLIENVSVSISAKIDVTISSNEDLYIAVFVYKNEGKIINSAVKENVILDGNTQMNTAFGSFVGINNGTIDNCQTLDKSSIVSENVDLAGICALNKDKGEILNSINNSTISQSGSDEKWNPNVGGIVIENCGKIDTCDNNASLTIKSNATQANDGGVYAYTYLGGIAAMNVYGAINNCSSNGKLTSDTLVNNVNVGGVASINYMTSSTSYGVIESCSVQCDIIIKSTENLTNIMVGGISGYNYAIIYNSYAIINWELNCTEDSYKCIGAIVGGITQSLYNNYLWGNKYMSGNKFYITESVGFSTGYDTLDRDFAGDGISSKEEILGSGD